MIVTDRPIMADEIDTALGHTAGTDCGADDSMALTHDSTVASPNPMSATASSGTATALRTIAAVFMVVLTTTVLVMRAASAMEFSVHLGSGPRLGGRSPSSSVMRAAPQMHKLLISTCVYEDSAIVRAQVVNTLAFTQETGPHWQRPARHAIQLRHFCFVMP